MRKLSKKLLSLALALVLCLSLVPGFFITTAHAGGRNRILIDKDGTIHNLGFRFQRITDPSGKTTEIKYDTDIIDGDGWSYSCEGEEETITLNGYHGIAIYGYFRKLVLAPGSENSLAALSVNGSYSDSFFLEGSGTLTLEFDEQTLFDEQLSKNTREAVFVNDIKNVFGNTAPHAFTLECALQDGKPECQLKISNGVSIVGGEKRGDSQSLNFVEHVDGQRVSILAETSNGTPASYIKISPAPPVSCNPTSNKLIIDGVKAASTAYVINGNNYIKLRDVAALLNGTSAQFDVEYDEYSKSILLIKHKGYQKLPSDLQAGLNNQIAKPGSVYFAIGNYVEREGSRGSVLFDSDHTLYTYAINGYNYFKLRDLGQLLNFNVKWDAASNSVVIETDKPYTGK